MKTNTSLFEEYKKVDMDEADKPATNKKHIETSKQVEYILLEIN